jgi:hypothetical protein
LQRIRNIAVSRVPKQIDVFERRHG